VRAISLHPDVILLTSQIWQTNCTIVRAGEECFMIDSPILPEELDALPAVFEGAGLSLSGLLATHGDWDHLLGHLVFPRSSLGAAQSTSERLSAAPEEPQRELRAFDEEHYIEREPFVLGRSQASPSPLQASPSPLQASPSPLQASPSPLQASPSPLQALPVPGRLAIGPHELELHPAAGHTCDGMAIWVPWARVLVAGDYLSSVEIPFFGEGGGSLEAYRVTLQRLRPLVGQAEHVVPGHGPFLDGAHALTVLEEDLAYLRALEEHGVDAQLPAGRRSEAQHRLHLENITTGGSSARPPAAG
jgi:glyoxylase-like metal-dependent hydrolase (beta-lactamase superfamily II)